MDNINDLKENIKKEMVTLASELIVTDNHSERYFEILNELIKHSQRFQEITKEEIIAKEGAEYYRGFEAAISAMKNLKVI